jgi:hypothetical protein
MPTKPLETVIYRELQIARATNFLDVATPLFQELVNHGSNALIRCESSSKRAENEDLAALNLYRHMLELTDAFEVLIAASCAEPTIPILRSMFETLLGLEYILESKTTYVQRSLSWLAAYVHRRIATYDAMLRDSQRGKQFQASVRKDKWIDDLPLPPQERVHQAIDRMERLLATDQFEEVEIEYSKFSSPPYWYQLFDGPSTIQQLAYRLQHHSLYDLLYRYWSSVSHAQDFSKFLAVDSTGAAGIRGFRDAGLLQNVSRFAATFIVEATRRMLLEFRPGEDFSKYYNAEVGHRFRQVMSREDFFI